MRRDAAMPTFTPNGNRNPANDCTNYYHEISVGLSSATTLKPKGIAETIPLPNCCVESSKREVAI